MVSPQKKKKKKGNSATKPDLLTNDRPFYTKGGDGTFGNFPEYLGLLVSRGLPGVRVVSVVYPKYETRGDFRECVSRFREW